MCNCIREITKKIKEQTKDDMAFIESVFLINTLSEVPKISFKYNARKKDGTKSKNKTEQILIPTFCPFCGVKYEAEK